MNKMRGANRPVAIICDEICHAATTRNETSAMQPSMAARNFTSQG